MLRRRHILTQHINLHTSARIRHSCIPDHMFSWRCVWQPLGPSSRIQGLLCARVLLRWGQDRGRVGSRLLLLLRGGAPTPTTAPEPRAGIIATCGCLASTWHSLLGSAGAHRPELCCGEEAPVRPPHPAAGVLMPRLVQVRLHRNRGFPINNIYHNRDVHHCMHRRHCWGEVPVRSPGGGGSRGGCSSPGAS